MLILLFWSSSASSVSISPPAEHHHLTANQPQGYILFSPMGSTTTYEIDYNGTVLHTWPSGNLPGYSVYPVGNGTIVRAARQGLEIGGIVQEIAWNGEILWEFTYNSDEHLSHHDIKPLPNGNVLVIAWEFKTEAETLAAGRNPNLQPTGPLIPDHLIEISPSGDIVWEWHVWDHLIQDYDPSKENYGVVKDHPELIDINFESQHSMMISDWTHLNSVDYNENLDQILLSSWYFNEIWVIDHSTTTLEAAGHTGGNRGKGGDLLYRWGNPRTYRTGNESDQKLFGQHDAQWIEAGCPGSGNIFVFNNGLDRPDGEYSSVEELVPPLTENGTYSYISGFPYLPENPFWVYTAPVPTDFYSEIISGCQRLPNGDTLICNGLKGVFFEVTPEKEVVWEYTNPYPNYQTNEVFKIHYIPRQSGPDLQAEGDLQWSEVDAGSPQTGSITLANIGEQNSRLSWGIDSYPSWGTWSFTPSSGQHLSPEDGPVTIQVMVIAPNQKDSQFTGDIKIVNLQDFGDYRIISVSLSTPVSSPHPLPLFRNFKQLAHCLIR